MANNTKYTGLTNYANYHTFSKLQVGNNVNFGGSVNRSGHTVTNTDAWLDDVPFFNTFTTPSAALSAVGKSAVKNDLVSIAVAEGDIAVGIYRRNDVDNTAGDKTFTEIFTPYTIGTDKNEEGATVLLNKDDKAVVRVWDKQRLTLLDGDNNSNADSEGQAARIIVDGAPVEQFIAIPDVCRSGYPSNGYAIKVYNDGTPMTMDFGTVTNTFFDVPFAGVIMFGGGTDGSVYTIDCFEYIGDKLAAVNTKIADIHEIINNLTIEAGAGIKELKEGTGIKVDASDPIKPSVSVDTTVIATAASVKDVADDVAEIQQTIQSGVVSSVSASSSAQTAGVTIGGSSTAPEITVEVGTVAEDVTKLVTGGAVSAAITSAAGTLQKSIEDTAKTAKDNLDSAVEAIEGSIDDVQNTLQGSINDIDTRVTEAEGKITVLEGAVDELTTGDNSVSSLINSAKEEIDGEIDTLTSTLRGEIGDAKDGAIEAAKDYTDTEIGKVSKSLEDAIAAHGRDIETIETTIQGITTTGLTREVLADGQTIESVTEPKANVIYLVKDATSETGFYVEYLFVNGTPEAIGTTSTDLSEYAKSADVTETLKGYTTTTVHGELVSRVETAEQTIATHTADITTAQETAEEGVEAAGKAQAAADKAQKEVDALEVVVNELTELVGENNTSATTGINEAKAAAQAADNKAEQAQKEVDALEDVVAQHVSDTTTALASKAAASDLQALDTIVSGHTSQLTEITSETIPGITGRLDAIEATSIEVVHAQGSTDAPNYVTVSTATEGGKTTFTVATTGALETRLDTLETFVGGSGEGGGLSELLAKKIDNVTGGSNGISISTADAADGRVATLQVNAIGSISETTGSSDSVVTAAAVKNYADSVGSTTLDTAKGYTEEKIGDLVESLNTTATADNTSISVVQVDGVITEVNVQKGTIAKDSTDLVDGDTVFAMKEALETTIGKKVEITAYTANKEATDAAIEALQGFVDSADAAYAVKGTETVASDAAAAAQAAQESADKKLSAISTTDTRISLGTPTADGDSKSMTIALASTVATTTDGTAYSKSETEDKIKAVADLVGTDSVETQITTAIEDLDSTASDYGITVTQVDGKLTTIEIVSGAITETETSVVTGSVVYAAVAEAKQAAKEAKDIAEAKISSVVVETESTHFGSALATHATTDTNVVITLAPAKEWSVGTTLPAEDIVSVINGKMSDGSTIDDAKLVDGTAMFADNKSLEVVVGSFSALTTGTNMFSGCTSLGTFVADLGSLSTAEGMFENCALDVESLIYIADSIADWTGDDAEHKITIGVATPDDEEVLALIAEIEGKGWVVA